MVSHIDASVALTLAALNGLDVKTADIMNAYIAAPVQEKVLTILGPEFGDDQGKKAIICRSLHGLKSSGAAVCNHLADCTRHLGYKPCMADPDLWIKPMVPPDDGELY